jgi:eukaryotic-like serine/threonine-protein kinase
MTLTFRLQPAPVEPTPEPTPLPTPTPIPTATPGPSLVSVPAVLGQSATTASRLLREAGLVVEVASVDAFSPSGAGTVATQDPQPAARLAPRSSVKLGIASGRVVIPSVRGRRESEAYATLRAAGFDIQTRRRSDDAIASGIALGTNPGDGASLGSGSSVELLISQGH